MRIFLRISSLLFILLFSLRASADDFALTTNAFLDTGALPVLYTCDGKDVSPELSWSNPPEKTKSFAMIISDPEAPNGTFYHWVVYNIPANTKELVEDIKNFPAGTVVGKNSFGASDYNGPCPPKGTAHTYEFTLYALDAPLVVPPNSDGKTVIDNMKNHIIKKVQITAVYSRWLQ